MRTYGAALASALVVGGSLAGLGVFLGFPTGPSLGFGAVCGLLAALLLLGASRRADTFHPTEANAHLADHTRDHTPDPRQDRPPGEGGGPGAQAPPDTPPDDPDEPSAGDLRG